MKRYLALTLVAGMLGAVGAPAGAAVASTETHSLANNTSRADHVALRQVDDPPAKQMELVATVKGIDFEKFALGGDGKVYGAPANEAGQWELVSIDLAAGAVSAPIATATNTGFATGMAVDGHGHLYIASSRGDDQVLSKVDLASGAVQALSSETLGIRIPMLSRMRTTSDGNIIMSTHEAGHPLIKLDTTTDHATLVGGALPNTTGLALTGDGIAYTTTPNQINKTDLNTGETTVGPWLSGFGSWAQSLAIDADGNGYAGDYTQGAVRKIDLNTGETSLFSTTRASAYMLDVDISGDGYLYAIDQIGMGLYRTKI